jgi:ABC-type antimicrobial peptide transport system permease subunit
MKISLWILAAGSFVTWLLFDRFTGLLAATLPFHGLEPEGLQTMVVTILSAPATWLALLVVALGALVAWVRVRGYALFGAYWLDPFVDSSFGFETLNRFIVRSTYSVAERFSKTQTGELNWNILGIFSALLVVLIVLWLGAQ